MTAIVVGLAIVIASPLCMLAYRGMCRTYDVDALRPLSQGRKPRG